MEESTGRGDYRGGEHLRSSFGRGSGWHCGAGALPVLPVAARPGGVTVSPGWPRARQEQGHPEELGPKAPTGHGALPGWLRPRASKAGGVGGSPRLGGML